MAKIEIKTTLKKSAPNLLLIPGGPGLSPVSFDAMKEYLSDINVYFYYPTGTYGDKVVSNLSYNHQLSELLTEVEKFEEVYLCGHSFGGIQVVDVALKSPKRIKGIICIATPFSSQSFIEVLNNYKNNKTDEQMTLDKQFDDNPSDEVYRKWFASYAPLYFAKNNIDCGRKMLLNDSVCVKSNLEAIEEAAQKEHLLAEIKNSSIKKIFIAGSEDQLLPAKILKIDSEMGNFPFQEIKQAGHFVHFDRPKETANIIKSFINNRGGIL